MTTKLLLEFFKELWRTYSVIAGQRTEVHRENMNNDGQDNLKRECTAAKFPILKTQNQINTMLKLLSWNRRSSANTEIHTHAMGIFLPSGERGDGGGGSVDLAGGNGMCGGGLREVETRWRDCEVTRGKRTVKLIKKHNEKLSSHKELHKHTADKGRWSRKQAGNSDFREHVNRKWTVGARGSELWHLVLMLVLPSPCTSEKCDRSGSSSSRSFRL